MSLMQPVISSTFTSHFQDTGKFIQLTQGVEIG